MPITSQPTAVQPTLSNSPAKAYELAFMIKESECADACVSSSKSDRKQSRPSNTGITECALTNSRKSIEVSIICSVFKCCGLKSGIACLLAGVAVLPCVRHNIPNFNGHARSEAEIDQLNSALKHIISDKVVEPTLEYEISTSIAEYQRKIARGKSNPKDVQRWQDKSRVLIRIHHLLRMKDLPNTWKVDLDKCKAENPEWNAGDFSTKTADFVGMAVAELSARALANGIETIEPTRRRDTQIDQRSAANEVGLNNVPVAEAVPVYQPPMAEQVLNPAMAAPETIPAPAPAAPSLWSRVFGASRSSVTPPTPPVSALGDGYAVELHIDQGPKIDL